jgi:hypothetical protein
MKIIMILFALVVGCTHDVIVVITDTGEDLDTESDAETTIETEIGTETIETEINTEIETEKDIESEIETDIDTNTAMDTVSEKETESEIEIDIDTNDTEAIIYSYDHEVATACGQYTTSAEDCITSCEYDAHKLKQDWYYDKLGILVDCDTFIHCDYDSNGVNWHCTCWILCNDV